MNCKTCKNLCTASGYDQDLPRGCDGYIPLSNADKIRHFNNAELAEFLEMFKLCPPGPGKHNEHCKNARKGCKTCWENWLEEAVSDADK